MLGDSCSLESMISLCVQLIKNHNKVPNSDEILFAFYNRQLGRLIYVQQIDFGFLEYDKSPPPHYK